MEEIIKKAEDAY